MSGLLVASVPPQRVRVSAGNWAQARWVLFGLVAVLTALTAECLQTGSLDFWLAQVSLAIAAYTSACILSNRALLNPMQSLLAYFYWWFGIGPIAISGFRLLTGDVAGAEYVHATFNDATFIVAIGLPLYALTSRQTLVWARRYRFAIPFLQPTGSTYSWATTGLMVVLWMCVSIVLNGILQIEPAAIVQVNMLGGTVTNVWWVAVLASLQRFLFIFVQITLLTGIYAARRDEKRVPGWVIIAAILVFSYGMYMAVVSGWKGAIMQLAILTLFVHVSATKRIPWRALLLGLLFFLCFVEPFVRTGRNIARRTGAESRSDRVAVFRGLLMNGELYESIGDLRNVNIDSPFRGIYGVAGQITKSAGVFTGRLEGQTIMDGILAALPRAIYPGKPDMNIGNVFSRIYGAELGISDEDDDVNNLAPSIPFEFVANYGLVAGVASFGFIGVVWTALCAFLLSPERVSDHPLTAWLILSSGKFEGVVGALVGWGREIPLILLFLWLIWRSVGRRL